MDVEHGNGLPSNKKEKSLIPQINARKIGKLLN